MKKVLCMLLVLAMMFSTLLISTNAAEKDITKTASQADSIVSVAQGEVGGCYTRNNKYTTWYYGGSKSVDWCAIFISWCANQAGISSDIVPHLAGAHSNFDWFNSRGLWHGKRTITWTYNGVTRSSVNDSSYVPKAGDIILRETSGGFSDGPDHVELVTGCSNGYVYTIGGNTSYFYKDGVYYSYVKSKSYSLSDSNIWGYCTPAYENTDTPIDLGTDFYAFIINSAMWKHLTVEQDNNVVIRNEKSDLCADQVWKFERQSDMSYKIISTANGECLDVDNAARESGTNVKTCTDNGNDAQRWYICGTDNHYTLKSKCTDCVLDIAGGYSDDGTNVQMYAKNNTYSQIFQVYKLSDRSFAANLGDDFTAPILNLKEWIPIENCDNGNIALQKETGKSNQLWRFKRQIDGSYRIFSCYDGRCIDLDMASHNNGTNIKICDANANDAQRWYLYTYAGGYTIQSKESGKLFDIEGGSLNFGTNIQAWEWNGTDSQIFAVYRGDECKLDAVQLSVTINNSNADFHWNNTYGETEFAIKLWQGDISKGEPYITDLHIPARSTDWQTELPMGHYEGYIISKNYYESFTSDIVSFDIQEPKQFVCLGDANGDGTVDAIDATIIQRYSLQIPVAFPYETLMHADVNGDGELDAVDATLIQRYALNIPTRYSIGESVAE